MSTRFLFLCVALASASALLAGPALADAASTLYVACNGGGNVQRLSTAGAFGAALPVTSPATPVAVAFDKVGNLYVANNHSPYSIEKYSVAGVDMGSFTTTTTGLNQPEGLAFDGNGILYVANTGNNTIEKYSSAGADLGAVVSTGLNRPVGLAFNRGNLYVVNANGNNVMEFTTGGTLLNTFTSSNLKTPFRIAFDSSDNFYVTNLLTSTIAKFSSAGVDQGVFASAGLNEPSGIAIDTDGAFYVCNVTSLNIEKISASGADQGSIASLPSGAMAADIALLAPGGQLAFSPTSYSTFEDAGTVTITVNRGNGSRGATSVAYSTTDGTARAPFDYTPTTGTLSWADGESGLKSFTVPILDSGITGGGSVNFMVALTGATGTGTLGMSAAATVTITDNDAAPAGQIQFNPAAYQTFEDAGTVTITANRVGGSRGATSVTYGTTDGTAKAGLDYTQTGGTLSWEDGNDDAKTFTVPLRDRAITGASVSFGVALLTVSGTGTLGTPAAATVTITDNDAAPSSQIQFSPAAYQTFEDAGAVTITVTRVGSTSGAVAVDYTTADGTAKAVTDYTATSGMLSWADGESKPKTFTVPIVNRSITGGSTVNFAVTLLRTSGAAALGTPSQAIVTIADNDQPPAPIQEPTATLTAPPPKPITVLRSTLSVDLEAAVSDPSNQLSSAQFLVNGSPVSTLVQGGFCFGSFDTRGGALPTGAYQIALQVTARDGTVSTSAASTINLVNPIGTVTRGASADFLAAIDHVTVAYSSLLSVDVMTTSVVDSTGATVSAVQRVDFYADGILFASRDGSGKTIPLPSRAPGHGPTTRDAFAGGSTSLFEATYQVPADGQPVTLQAVVTTTDGLNQLTAPLHLTPVAETGAPPTATVGPLTSGLPIPAGASLVVPVTVSAPSVPVAMVQYYLNGALLSAATAPPFDVTVTPPTAGSYALTAVVTDTNGVSTFAAPLAFQAVPTVSLAIKGTGLAIVGGAKGKVIFTRTGDDTSTPLTVFFKHGGTAKDGVNYEDVGTQLVIPAGQSSFKLKIKPIDTGAGPFTGKANIKLAPAPDGSYLPGDAFKAKVTLQQAQ